MNINNILTRRKRFENICWILSVVLIILSLNKNDICICDYSKTINLPVWLHAYNGRLLPGLQAVCWINKQLIILGELSNEIFWLRFIHYQLFIIKIFFMAEIVPWRLSYRQKICQQQGYSQLLMKINVLILSFLHQFKLTTYLEDKLIYLTSHTYWSMLHFSMVTSH